MSETLDAARYGSFYSYTSTYSPTYHHHHPSSSSSSISFIFVQPGVTTGHVFFLSFCKALLLL